MKTLYGSVFTFILLLGVLSWGSVIHAAEEYPLKPITLIVPMEAGSDGDIISRQLLEKASAILGKPVVVVNKPGAGSTIGYRELYNAKPDGYTIGNATQTIITSKMQGLFPYDYRDFTPMVFFHAKDHVIVASTKTKRPFKTIEDVISYAKSHPGEVSMASAGVGQGQWVGAMVFITGTGIELNMILQEGAGGLTVTQVAGGHAELTVGGLVGLKPHIQAGNMRLLATMGEKRLGGEFSNVPTLKELGYDALSDTCSLLIGPAKMPKDIGNKIVKAFQAATNDPKFLTYLEKVHSTPIPMTPDELVNWLDKKRITYERIMRKAGIFKGK